MPEKKPPQKPKTKPIALEDRDLWEAVTHDVVRIHQKTHQPTPHPRKVHVKARSSAVSGTISLEIAKPQPSKSSFQLDATLQKRFMRGELPIDGKIDLHGLTLDRAHQRFKSFVLGKINGGARCLLVITGKGAGGEGVIRKNLPFWCDDPALHPFILQTTIASPKHGGSGATYLLLRRVRNI